MVQFANQTVVAFCQLSIVNCLPDSMLSRLGGFWGFVRVYFIEKFLVFWQLHSF